MCERRPLSVLKANLHREAGMDVRLVHYPPNLRQPLHRHDETQLSVLLAGRLQETTAKAEVEAVQRASGWKPPGESHAAAFGPQGALMLSVTMDEEANGALKPVEWRPSSPALDQVIGALLRSDDAGERAALAADLRMLIEAAEPEIGARSRRDVAGRLRDALDADEGEAGIQHLARRLGLHRTHLSRCFVEAYGLAPSVYRSRAAAARAVNLALRSGLDLAAVAAEAGFADQSHLARSGRQWLGAPLSRIRRLFADATSVQVAAA